MALKRKALTLMSAGGLAVIGLVRSGHRARRHTGRLRSAALIAATLGALAIPAVTVYGDSLYPYPFPYERNNVHDLVDSYTRFPYSTIGKLFFEDPQTQTPKHCSASVLNAPNKSLIFTAAHCLHSAGPNGHWYDYFLFVPQYDNGATPFGEFTWRNAYVPDAWANNGDLSRDYGWLIVNQHNNGYVQDLVGSLGYEYNASRKQHWHIEGYPQGGTFTGGDMVECTSSYAADGDSNTLGTGCDMSGGVGGSPWIANFSNYALSGNDFINGVASYQLSNPSQPDAVYGPYLDGQWYNEYTAIDNK